MEETGVVFSDEEGTGVVFSVVEETGVVFSDEEGTGVGLTVGVSVGLVEQRLVVVRVIVLVWVTGTVEV